MRHWRSLCPHNKYLPKTKPAIDPWKDRWPVSGNLSPGAVSQTPRDSPSPDRPSTRRADRNSSSDSCWRNRSYQVRVTGQNVLQDTNIFVLSSRSRLKMGIGRSENPGTPRRKYHTALAPDVKGYLTVREELSGLFFETRTGDFWEIQSSTLVRKSKAVPIWPRLAQLIS